MAAVMTRSLDSIPKGGKSVVVTMEAMGLSRRRLLDIGLVPGTVVETVRRSPAGDPIAYLIRGATIALRAEDGRKIRVLPV